MLCRSLLAAGTVAAAPEPTVGQETGSDASTCPVCGRGQLVIIERLQPAQVIVEGQGGLVLQEAGATEGAATD